MDYNNEITNIMVEMLMEETIKKYKHYITNPTNSNYKKLTEAISLSCDEASSLLARQVLICTSKTNNKLFNLYLEILKYI